MFQLIKYAYIDLWTSSIWKGYKNRKKTYWSLLWASCFNSKVRGNISIVQEQNQKMRVSLQFRDKRGQEMFFPAVMLQFTRSPMDITPFSKGDNYLLSPSNTVICTSIYIHICYTNVYSYLYRYILTNYAYEHCFLLLKYDDPSELVWNTFISTK